MMQIFFLLMIISMPNQPSVKYNASIYPTEQECYQALDLRKIQELKMAEPSQNREDIIKIDGELRLIHQKLDNHITHMSAKIDTIFKIVWTVSFMVLGLLLKSVYSGLIS